jgi:5-methylcytosine-specific restriction endonuclease McrA
VPVEAEAARDIDPKVGPKLRFRILVRDRFRCVYCGRKPPEVKLAVDHVVPRAKGGKTEPGNLVSSCDPCNSGKSDTTTWGEDDES